MTHGQWAVASAETVLACAAFQSQMSNQVAHIQGLEIPMCREGEGEAELDNALPINLVQAASRAMPSIARTMPRPQNQCHAVL